MIDREVAEAVAKAFLNQKFPDVATGDPFARFAEAMEFTDSNGNEILISMADNGVKYFCEVTIGGKTKRCYDYHNQDAIADTICEFALRDQFRGL